MAAPYFPKLERKIFSLKQQKRKMQQRFLWRSILISSFAGGLLTTTIIAQGKIHHPSQVKIEGSHLVDSQIIHSLLNIDYPAFLWQIPSQTLSKNLESIPPIAKTKINKQLFPPLVEVFLEERQPVAIALSTSGNNLGFLDAEGVWLDPKYYKTSDSVTTFPTLKVINFHPSYSSIWSETFNLIQVYPDIKIDEVRWDDSNAMYLKSNLGTIYLGSDRSILKQQFHAIASLQNLPEYLELSQIHYIDLTNPQSYSIQKYSKSQAK